MLCVVLFKFTYLLACQARITLWSSRALSSWEVVLLRDTREMCITQTQLDEMVLTIPRAENLQAIGQMMARFNSQERSVLKKHSRAQL